MQVLGALGDCAKYSRQRRIVLATRNLGARMGERGQRPQRIIQLVAQDPDQLFPG